MEASNETTPQELISSNSVESVGGGKKSKRKKEKSQKKSKKEKKNSKLDQDASKEDVSSIFPPAQIQQLEREQEVQIAKKISLSISVT